MKRISDVLSSRRSLFSTIVFVAACVAAYFALSLFFVGREEASKASRAAFFADTIGGALERLEHLPFVIAKDSMIVQALIEEDGGQINPLLAEFGQRADAEEVYVMDLGGQTIAASNFADEISFIGEFYTFRPYFQDAIAGRTGRYFAVGATSGRPGYFVSEPVRNAFGRIIGVVVVKIGLDALNRAWRDSGERILVTNRAGVVLLASEDRYLFSTIRPLPGGERQEIESLQQFGNRPLDRLDWEVHGETRVRLDGVEYLYSTADVTGEGWQLHLLSSLAGSQQRAALAVFSVAVAVLALVIVMAGYRSRQLRTALAVSDADRARLAREIEVRRAAEAQLKAAQVELERSSRLAALGQLSASITHELGQPISAMRNYLVAEEIAEGAAPGALNRQLGALVERMQGITQQLRFFATPGGAERRVFSMSDAIEGAEALVKHDLDAKGVSLSLDFGAKPACVSGDQHRLEQVLVNLLRNAVHAVAECKVREIRVQVRVERREVVTDVRDTGEGLMGQSFGDLQEPFVTTKSSGEGMGLGLAISAQIVKEMGGTLDARDGEAGGAIFTITLPHAEDMT